MLAKTWKQIGLIILIVACIVNILNKTVTKVSFIDQVKAVAVYLQSKTK